MATSLSAEQALSPREQRIVKLCKKRRLFVFLRLHRHLIFDDEVVGKLHEMYGSGGRPAHDPVCLGLAMLLQVALDVADHEVPTLTAVDSRWRMVLGLLSAPEASAFSQGTVFNYRERALTAGLAQILLRKTVEVARATKGFDHKRLRAIFDSSPLFGAGRVEDTFNLIGGAIGKLVAVAAKRAGKTAEQVAAEQGLTVVSASSVKAALDVDWREPTARLEALNVLLSQFQRTQRWLEEEFSRTELEEPPLSDALAVVQRLVEQDTEPEPDPPETSEGEGGHPPRRLRENKRSDGKRDRQISLSDPEMRHGRKSATKSFAGYKRHVAVDADIPGLVTEVALVAANVCEYEAAPALLDALEADGWQVTELQIDRGYLAAEAIHERRNNAGLRVVSKPPTPPRRDRFTKNDFDIDFETNVVTCPNGQTKQMTPSRRVQFPKGVCAKCPKRERCLPNSGRRQLVIHPNEQFFREMAAELATPEGRAQRRERVLVEHALAHVGQVQGKRARFKGLRKNLFDLQRSATVANIYVIDRLLAA